MSTHESEHSPLASRDESRDDIKARFIAERGYWRPWVDEMLQVSPGFVAQYAHYAGYPARTGPLTPRMVELIYVALDASSSHLFESGLQTHTQKSLEAGATQNDIFDVLHLVTVQGMAGVCQAANILAELTTSAGRPQPLELDAALQARIDRLGPAHALALAPVARLDPGYAAALLDFVEQGRPGGGLLDTERSLVQLALHACFTAHNPGAVRQIITTALAQGVPTAELLQAIQLGAHLAVHGTALGVNVYRQVVGQQAEAGGSGSRPDM